MGRSLLIFSDIIFKMAAWWPYCFFGFWTLKAAWFLECKSSLLWSFNFIICILMVVKGRSLGIWVRAYWLSATSLSKWPPGDHFVFLVSRPWLLFGREHQLQTSVAQYLCIWVGACWFAATLISKWPPGGHIGFFGVRTLTLVWLRISTPNFNGTVHMYMGRSLLI